jgi:hypothetical protein
MVSEQLRTKPVLAGLPAREVPILAVGDAVNPDGIRLESYVRYSYSVALVSDDISVPGLRMALGQKQDTCPEPRGPRRRPAALALCSAMRRRLRTQQRGRRGRR